MKLSEVLKEDWPEKQEKEYQEECIELYQQDGFNTALTSCDREIDREALEKILLKPSKSQENNINFGVVNDYKARYLAQAIISTMPTWLKKAGKNE